MQELLEAESQSPVVRPVTEADLPALFVLASQCFPQDAWSLERLREDTQGPHAVGLVVEANQTLLGFVLARLVLDELELHQVAVHPSVRRLGYAQALLQALRARTLPDGMRVIFLEVRASNEPARRFYEKHGFQHMGVRRAYYSQPTEDAILMSWRPPEAS